ncbi:hypothetical protein M0802_007470 [Mischocyttarus mexicanus]|nr:hypothetical protein M0802_007470 [Mischocyttarus mexicanus]
MKEEEDIKGQGGGGKERSLDEIDLENPAGTSSFLFLHNQSRSRRKRRRKRVGAFGFPVSSVLFPIQPSLLLVVLEVGASGLLTARNNG